MTLITPELEILSTIHRLLRDQLPIPNKIRGLSFDNDNDSGEIILTHANGRDYKISVEDLGVWNPKTEDYKQ